MAKIEKSQAGSRDREWASTEIKIYPFVGGDPYLFVEKKKARKEQKYEWNSREERGGRQEN